VPFFLGIGIRRLSVDPHFLPEVQRCVMGWSTQAATAYADRLLSKSQIKEVEALLLSGPPSAGV